MKKKQKLVSDRIVEELIKQATKRAARDVGISTRNAPTPQNMCAAATAKYNRIKNKIRAAHPTGGVSDNEFSELLDARLAMDLVCDPE